MESSSSSSEGATLLSVREHSSHAAAHGRAPRAPCAWASRRGWLGLPAGAWAGAAVAAVALVTTVVAVRAAAPAAAAGGGGGGGGGGADACSWPSYRLPALGEAGGAAGGAAASAYSVRWDIAAAFAPPYAFGGAAEVELTRDTPAGVSACACLLLHARGLQIDGAAASASTVGGGGAWWPVAVSADPLPLSERVIVRLPAALRGEAALRLSFTFSGLLSDTVIGFYASTYVNTTGVSVPLVQTKFEPAFARTAFPCLDEPALKARFNLTLTGVPRSYTALSNMPAAGAPVVSADGATYSIAFDQSPRMSTYQLTAVVAPMVSVGGMLAPALSRTAAVPVTVWTMDRGDASLLAGLAFANATAIAVMAFYEAALRVAFPLPKMDLVYLPQFPVGAMEQWGLITYTETYLASGVNGSASAAGVIAHELAHQWFGNLVTAEWWDCLWLQEGMATFWPYLSLPAGAPAVGYAVGWRAATAGAMAEDAYAASQALTVATPVASSGASYATFSTITYDKGAAVIAGLARRVDGAAGAGAFLRAMNAYLVAHAYNATRPADLLAALVAAAPSALAGLAGEMAPLLAEAGLPLVVAAWDGGSPRKLALTQSRFFAGAASAALAPSAPPPWTVPVLVSAAHASPALLAGAAAAAAAYSLHGGLGPGADLALRLAYDPAVDGWLTLSNGSAAEYFRVLLPADAYEALAAAMAPGSNASVPPADARAALLDDLFAAAEAQVASAPAGGVAYALAWAARWVAGDTAPAVRAAVASRTARLAALLTDDVPLAAAGAPATRPAAATPGTPAYACLQALLAYARDRLAVSPAAVASINASTAGANRYAAADALAAPMDAANASAILSRVATGATRDIAWAWMRANWRTLYAFFGFRSTLSTLVRTVTRAFVSPEYAADVAGVFAELQAGPLAATVVDGAWQRAVESVRANAAWAASADAAAVCALVLAAADDRATPDAAVAAGAADAREWAERQGVRLWNEV